MKLIFDYRVLTHKTYTGVENYAQKVLENIQRRVDLKICKPKASNKYLAHLWEHCILPFQSADVLFCPANIAPIYVPKRKKLVVTLHDVSFITFPKSFSFFFRIYYRLLIPFVVKRADKIITVSKSSMSEIEKYYPESIGKIEVVSLGVEDKFRRLKNIKKKKQILYVGSMNERKNFLGVLKAFELLEKKDYKLVMVGNFSEIFNLDEKSLEVLDLSKKNPNIEFKNYVSNDDLVQIYNESELFILPSFYEGFGLPVLESMACGTAVICSNTTSLPEVGGDAVVYCNPYDINDIKEKIELVLDDKELQNKVIARGFERVKDFTWEKTANSHIEIFEKVFKN